MSSNLFFFPSNYFDYLRFLRLSYEFYYGIKVSISTKTHHWNCERDCIDALDYTGYQGHFSSFVLLFMNMGCLSVH